MNAFASSECSSGCESGWTVYLEQSFLSPTRRGKKCSKHFDTKNAKEVEEKPEAENENEDDDLSMVSDASSGPPHFNDDENYFNYDNGYFYPAYKDSTTLINNGGDLKEKRRRVKSDKEHQELPSSFLDDTASSPAFNLYKSNFSSRETILGYSQGFSANNFEGRSAYQDHFGHVQPSPSGTQLQHNQWYFKERE